LKLEKKKKVKVKRHTLEWKFAELAGDEKSIRLVFASGEAFGGEEREKRVPSEGGSYEVQPSADEVAVEPERGWVKPKGPRNGAQVDSLVLPGHHFCQLGEGGA